MKVSAKRILILFTLICFIVPLTRFFSDMDQKCRFSKKDVTSFDEILMELRKQIGKSDVMENLLEKRLYQHKEISAENNVLLHTLLNKTLITEETKNQDKVGVKKAKIEGNLLVNKTQSLSQAIEPTLGEEVLKRKIKNNAIELFYSINSSLSLIPISDSKQKEKALQQLSAQHADMMANIEKLLNLNDDWKKQEMKSLEDLVQKRILYVQNPSSCKAAKKLLCNVNKKCGFGCQIHHVAYCLMVAFGSNRTMILDSKYWNKQTKGWEAVFQPVSKTCTQIPKYDSIWRMNNKDPVVLFPIIEALFTTPLYAPQGIPKDIAFRLKRLHGHPGVWWVGQFIKYLFREQDWLENDLKKYQDEVGYDEPIVGMHVRRTDKILEARYHEIAEYMQYVIRWYDIYDMKHMGEKKVKRRVYIATDDPSVIQQAKDLYKDYEFVNFKAFSESAFNPFLRNINLNSLKGIISDIYLLSLCDYIVCTFSSQVCRTAYELMQTRRPDASFDVQSLDDVYYYGGQKAHQQLAIYDHKPDPENNEIELRVGDVIQLAGNHWDGYSKGRNTRTSIMGLYPSWKVEDIIEEIQYPIYPKTNGTNV